jgi:hypothetical protein
LNEELGGLVLDNYRIFVAAFKNGDMLQNDKDLLRRGVGETASSLAALKFNSEHFKTRVDPLLQAYRRNKKTLRVQMELIELLEVPQLVDACARNGFHEEALELAVVSVPYGTVPLRKYLITMLHSLSAAWSGGTSWLTRCGSGPMTLRAAQWCGP